MSEDRSGSRTIRVRCSSWEQVEAFYAEKLRGNILVVKMPYKPAMGATFTVALGLPDGLVFAIDGTVTKIGTEEKAKIPVALRMSGLTPEVRASLARLVSEGRQAKPRMATEPPVETAPAPEDTIAPAIVEEVVEAEPEPRVEDVLVEERAIFTALEATRKRLTALRAHEVLGVADDADLAAVRRGYFTLIKRYHPDVYGKYRSRAVRRLASDVFIHVNRAFDRMREAAATRAGRRLTGPAATAREGWLADLDDMQAGANLGRLSGQMAAIDQPATVTFTTPGNPMKELIVKVPIPAARADDYGEEVSFSTSVKMKALTAEELFGDEKPQLTASITPPLGFTSVPHEGAEPAPAPGPEPGNDHSLEELAHKGREHLHAGHWREACEAFAAALRGDPKNRRVRALYHVANGMDLRSKGEGAKATLQLETALQHDRDCEEAKLALKGQPFKKGLFKRIFDR